MNVEETVVEFANSTDTLTGTIAAGAETLIIAIATVSKGPSGTRWYDYDASWTVASNLVNTTQGVAFWKYNATAGDVTFSAVNKDYPSLTATDFDEAILHLIEISGADQIDYSLNRNYLQYSDDSKFYGSFEISREGNIGVLNVRMGYDGADATPPSGWSTCAETDSVLGTGSFCTYWAALPYSTLYTVYGTTPGDQIWYSVSLGTALTINQSPMLGSDF